MHRDASVYRLKSTATISLLLLAGIARAQTDDSSVSVPPEVPLVKKSFEQLSERNVTRTGERALKIKGVTWEHSETEHFIFHTETGFLVPQLANASEGFYKSIKKDLGVTEDAFQRKSHVYVFLDDAAWRTFAAQVSLEEWTGGFCNGRELFLQTRPHFKFQGTTLPHEMTHLVIHRFLAGDLPLCLNEGFAEFESTRLYRAYLKDRQYRLRLLSPPVSKDRYISVSALTGAVDYPREKEDVTAFYNEAQRLVIFLHEQGGGTAPLVQFLKRQSEGRNFETALREIYGEKFDNLEAFEKKFQPFATTQ
jgi:hypothetical protein